MTQFVRVKSAVKSDPQHEFDVSVAEYEANKSTYTRIGPGATDEPGPVLYVEAPTSEPTGKVRSTKK
jgi:hypothetical protein